LWLLFLIGDTDGDTETNADDDDNDDDDNDGTENDIVVCPPNEPQSFVLSIQLLLLFPGWPGRDA